MYRDLTSLSFPLAVPSSIADKVVNPLTDHSTAQNFFAPNYVSPYVQTFTLGITRSLPGNLLLDVKYLGTRGVKLHSSINYNEPDFQYNGLLEALATTRAGGNAAIFDQMFKASTSALESAWSARTSQARKHFAGIRRSVRTSRTGISGMWQTR